MTVAIGRGACNSPFDGRRRINRRKNASWIEVAYMMTPLRKATQPEPATPPWFAQAHKQHVAQNFPIGYRIHLGPHTGELVGTYASYTERYYRFRFADASQRVISQAQLHKLVSKLVALSPRLLPAGRIRGNHQQVETPEVIYLPAKIEKVAG